MIFNEQYQAISELDLEPIKVKLMHEESGEGWSLEKTNAVEFEYRRFLILMKKYPSEQTAPLVDVDTFWHYHILDTMKYASDCDQVFGYFLHHFPYIGLRGEDDEKAHEHVGQRMRELYEETFGESYIHTQAPQVPQAAAFSGIVAKTAFSGIVAKTAFSGIVAKTAFSGIVAKTAFSGIVAKTAFSGIVAKTAFSGIVAKTASSGINAKTAFSGIDASAGAQQSEAAKSHSEGVKRFYSERPRLSAV
jgi:hypothetical protein